jgi:kindlin 2
MLRYNSDLNLVKSWPLSTMKSWNVKWDSKQFEIEFDDENVIFYCTSPLNPKVLHEFIGGYIFMSLRTQANTNQFDKEMFFKLTNKR